MKTFYIVGGILVTLALAVILGLLATSTADRTIPPTAVTFPVNDESMTIDRSTSSVSGTTDATQMTTPLDESRYESAPGSLAVPSPLDVSMMQRLIQKAQELPPDEQGIRYVLVMQTEFDIYIVPDAVHEWVIDVTLKKDPIHYYRMLAEAFTAQQIGVERDDLCGIPFHIHTTPEHPASELGNLGLEACGVDKMVGTSWETYEIPVE